MIGAPRALFHLARPRGAVLIASLPLVGFGYGLWERGSTIHPRFIAPTLGALFLVWVLGHAGAMWLNAELDRDEGEVLLGRAVRVPRHTGLAGYAALALSIAGSVLWLGPLTTGCVVACAVLAVLYSHPGVALKGRPLSGPLINGVGYGSLSPVAGWAAADVPVTARALASLGFAVAFILGVYFVAQAFQADEDRERGYRTLVATHGPQRTLQFARALLDASALGVMTLAALGAYPRATLLALPFFVWMDRHLAAWIERGVGGRESDAKKLLGIVCAAAITMIAATYGHQAWAIWHDSPTGGCGTAWVPEALDEVCAPSGRVDAEQDQADRGPA